MGKKAWVYPDTCKGGEHRFKDANGVAYIGHDGCNLFPEPMALPLEYRCWVCGQEVWEEVPMQPISSHRFPPPGYDPIECLSVPEPSQMLVLVVGLLLLKGFEKWREAN